MIFLNKFEKRKNLRYQIVRIPQTPICLFFYYINRKRKQKNAAAGAAGKRAKGERSAPGRQRGDLRDGAVDQLGERELLGAGDDA